MRGRRLSLLVLISLWLLHCSVTNDLDDLKANADAGAGAGGTAASCESGDCTQCVTCEGFCACATTTPAAEQLCVQTACADAGGAGGMAGSGGASGSSGASGGGGCNLSVLGVPGQCSDCTEVNCCPEATACLAASACMSYVGCWVACDPNNTSCVNDCATSHPSGASDGKALIDCVNASCATEC
ncbi:MAG: hypothetical protein R3B13_17735 [Polyangiaceae bacterium]